MTDDELKTALKKSAHDIPENPFFVRKVVNRLPEKEPSFVRWIIPAAYAIAGVILLFFWWMFYTSDSTDFDRNMFYSLWVFSIAITLIPLRNKIASVRR